MMDWVASSLRWSKHGCSYFNSDVRRRRRCRPNGRPMDRPVALPCTLQGASLQYIRSSARLVGSHACKGKHSIDTTLLLLLQGNSKKVWDAWLDRTSTSTSTGWMASNATPCSGLVEQIQMREVGAAQSRACVRPHHDWSLGDALTSRLPLPARPVDHHHIVHHLISSRTAYASCMSRLCMYHTTMQCNGVHCCHGRVCLATRPGGWSRGQAASSPSIPASYV